MGPYEVDYVRLILSILTDFRVIAATVMVLLSWALLRYVGVVFYRARISLPPPRKMLRKKRAAPEAPAIEVEE